jgi:hypothetical protein
MIFCESIIIYVSMDMITGRILAGQWVEGKQKHVLEKGSEMWFLGAGHKIDYPAILIRSPKKQTGIPDRLFPLQ